MNVHAATRFPLSLRLEALSCDVPTQTVVGAAQNPDAPAAATPIGARDASECAI